ncbi:MAG: type II toxin-antitoxin system RelE/ParE family toxin [Desulfobacteraceae bacterium]|nr:type II toxin-antitoxin system RelE/ParE family toxin [Desulfobacteraceae bacterium]
MLYFNNIYSEQHPPRLSRFRPVMRTPAGYLFPKMFHSARVKYFQNKQIELKIVSLSAIVKNMIKLITKHFSKWVTKEHIPSNELITALEEVQVGSFEANLGGHIYKKRIRFDGKGKSGSGRTIICYKKEDRAIFIHGFAKNEKSNLSKKELFGLKEFSKILLGL